ncbi:MAG: hypothetical protein QOE93_386, partial [Actinomycetota bacterium]|nr:hypothetical protein [Actinomycetota bacterium]
DVELPHRFRQPGRPDKVAEPGLELAGGGNGQVMIGEDPPSVDSAVRVPMPAGPRRHDLDEASAIKPRDPQKRSRRAVGRRRHGTRRENKPVQPLLPCG